MSDSSAVLPIQHHWHHAVNSQDRLDEALASINETTSKIQSIEADIIFSEAKQRAVMGHPPDKDGDLTLRSFLDQLHQTCFQYSCGSSTNRIVKLDFKCMKSFETSITHIQSYLKHLPQEYHPLVWINADILPGPGENLCDSQSQLKMKPKFVASEFLDIVTTQLAGTTLSIGWTTSLTDKRALYTKEMIDDMLEVLKPYEKLSITFPIRATSFRDSWNVLQKLYTQNWTLTLWWSLDTLDSKEFDWIYKTLEEEKKIHMNRTYYDLLGFEEYTNKV